MNEHPAHWFFDGGALLRGSHARSLWVGDVSDVIADSHNLQVNFLQEQIDRLQAELDEARGPTGAECADCIDAGGRVECRTAEPEWATVGMTAAFWREPSRVDVRFPGFRCVQPPQPRTERVPWWEALRDRRAFAGSGLAVSKGGLNDSLIPWVGNDVETYYTSMVEVLVEDES